MVLAGEFDIIARVFAPLAKESGALALKDDAAILTMSDDQQLVVTCDTLVENVHFLSNDPPDSIGHKALAVNLSDLTAKGADVYAYTLSLALPKETDIAWLAGFAKGLAAVQEQTGISLIGGDTTATPGPPTITITALGLVPHETAVTRSGAKPGDSLYANGPIGDAYLGLRLLQEPNPARTWNLADEDRAYLIDRYRRPYVDPHAAQLIRSFAKAAIDVSDGLAADIEKLCDVSHVGAAIEASRIPLSRAARKVVAEDPDILADLVSSGDDYVAVVAISESSSNAFETHADDQNSGFVRIGTVVPAEESVVILDEAGAPIHLSKKGFTHF